RGARIDRLEHPKEAQRILDVLVVREVDRRPLPLDVRPGAERFTPAGEDDGPGVPDVGEGIVQRGDQRRVERVAALGSSEPDAQNVAVAFDVQHVATLSFALPVRPTRNTRAVAAAAAATIVALLSAWHSGRHMWRVLGTQRLAYDAYSDADRRHAPLAQL